MKLEEMKSRVMEIEGLMSERTQLLEIFDFLPDTIALTRRDPYRRVEVPGNMLQRTVEYLRFEFKNRLTEIDARIAELESNGDAP